MKSFYIKAFGIGLLNLVLFLLVFRALQDPVIYNHTLGLISKNYEKTGPYENQSIQQVDKPFLEITDSHLEHWDADIYKCIRDRGYQTGEGCYEQVKAAFFPLFPFLWKVFGSSTRLVCLFNYLLFAASLALLTRYLMNGTENEKLILYFFALSLPSSVIYYIPYTESLFLFSMTLAVIGMLKNKYWIFFSGLLLLAMTRPASVFLLLAFLAVLMIRQIRCRNFRNLVQELFQISSPFLIGYGIVLGIQYGYSHSLTKIFEAQKFWSGAWQIPGKFTDWSVEGFGLSSVALILFCVPSFLYLLYSTFSKRYQYATTLNLFKQSQEAKNEFIFRTATAYLAGFLLYVLFYKGGSLQSFFRYTLCTPLFFILLFLSLEKIKYSSITFRMLLFVLPVLLLSLFLAMVDYGGSKTSFQFAGMHLYLLYILFYVFQSFIHPRVRLFSLLVIWIASTVWTSYLFNMFMSDAWVFT